MAKITQKTDNNAVKLINVAGHGPMLAIIQADAPEAIVVTSPCQLGLDEEGGLVIRDYLEGVSDFEKQVIFMKSNIVSVSDPVQSLADAYLEAIANLETDEPQIIVPSQKIIL